MREPRLARPLQLDMRAVDIIEAEHDQIGIAIKELQLVNVGLRYHVDQTVSGGGPGVWWYGFQLEHKASVYTVSLKKRMRGWEIAYPNMTRTGTLDELLHRLKRWVLSRS